MFDDEWRQQSISLLLLIEHKTKSVIMSICRAAIAIHQSGSNDLYIQIIAGQSPHIGGSPKCSQSKCRCVSVPNCLSRFAYRHKRPLSHAPKHWQCASLSTKSSYLSSHVRSRCCPTHGLHLFLLSAGLLGTMVPQGRPCLFCPGPLWCPHPRS